MLEVSPYMYSKTLNCNTLDDFGSFITTNSQPCVTVQYTYSVHVHVFYCKAHMYMYMYHNKNVIKLKLDLIKAN